jgi:hypothetical protein
MGYGKSGEIPAFIYIRQEFWIVWINMKYIQNNIIDSSAKAYQSGTFRNKES